MALSCFAEVCNRRELKAAKIIVSDRGGSEFTSGS